LAAETDDTSIEDIARLRHTDPASLARELRGDLDWIVMRCLEKDRTRRYETANGLALDIRRHMNHEPVLASPPGVRYRLEKFVRRNRAAATTAAGIAVVLVAATVVSAVFGLAAVRARSGLQSALEREAEQRQEAERLGTEALAARDDAEQRNLELKRIAYAGEIRSVADLWQAGMLKGLVERVERLAPEEPTFEWKWWRNRVDTVPSHRFQVKGARAAKVLEFSPDGSRAYIGFVSGESRLYLASTWQLETELPTQPAHIRDAGFAPDGTRLLLSLETGGQTLYEVPSGREIEHSSLPSWSAAYALNGESIATVDGLGRISILDPDDLSVRRRFESIGCIVESLEFSPDGQRLLTAGADGIARLHDVNSGHVLAEMLHSPEGEQVWSARFSDDGRLVATTGRGGRVLLWRADNGAFLRELRSHRQRNNSNWHSRDADFSDDGRMLVTGGNDGLLRIQNVETGALECLMKATWPDGFDGALRSVRVDPSGTRVVAGGGMGVVFVWSLDGIGVPLEMMGHRQGIIETCATPDGDFVFSVGADGTLRKWDLLSGRQVFSRQVASVGALSVDLTADGGRVVVGTLDGFGSVHDASSGTLLQTFSMPKGTGAPTAGSRWPLARNPGGSRVGLMCVRVDPNDRTIAAGVGTWAMNRQGDREVAIHLFDLDSGEHLTPLDGHRASVSGLAFAENGQTLFSVGYDDRLMCWDLRDPSLPPTVVFTHPEGAFAMDVLVDDSRELVLSAFSSGEVLAHRLEDHSLAWSFQAHDSGVSSLSLSPDGRRLLTTASNVSGAALWDLDAHTLLLTFADHLPVISAASFAGRDRVVVGGMLDGRLYGFEAVPPAGRFEQRMAVRRVQADRDARWRAIKTLLDRAIDAREQQRPEEAGALLDVVTARIESDLSDQPDAAAELHQTVGNQYRLLWRDDEALRACNLALAHYKQNELLARKHARILREIGYCHDGVLRRTEAQAHFEESLSLARAALGERDEETIWSMAALAGAYVDAGKLDLAEPLYVRALELTGELYGKESKETAIWLANLARLYGLRGDFDTALQKARRALDIDRRTRGPDHSVTLSRMHRVAYLLVRRGDYSEAIEMLPGIIEGRTNVLGPLHSGTLSSMYLLAEAYFLSGATDEGERFCREVLDGFLAMEPDLSVAWALNMAAWSVVVHPNLSADLYERALRAAQRSVDLDESEWFNTLNTLGTAQYRFGRYEQALETLARSDELQPELSDPGDWAFMAMAYHQLDNHDEAKAALSRLRELMQAPDYVNDHQRLMFLREAEAMIEGGADQ
jgi:WD40 repeat protein